jgi:uncharacterized protein with NAD-binding domain and iron-sulfur cluster
LSRIFAHRSVFELFEVSSQKPIEVAVIGGGCAAITAAFELSRPQHQGKFHVTIYQLGWRLGGKGASGRGPNDRIEEHGLHIWMGFYENAFQLLRECYAELNRDPHTSRIADWRDAFVPAPLVGVMDQSPRGEWNPWLAMFPPAEGSPGDPLANHNPFTVTAYLLQLATMLRVTIASAQILQNPAASQTQTNADPAASTASAQNSGTTSADQISDMIARLLKYGLLATVAGLTEGVALLEVLFRTLPLYPADIVTSLLSTIGIAARAQLEPMIETDDELRRLWEVIDLTLATMTGIVRFGLTTDPRGFDAIDDYELLDWLRLNGASESSLKSAVIRGIYDLAFAYQDADPKRPFQAAGLAMRGSLRMFFTYRGAFFWRMQAAMGDVVFAPFYEVLKRRGVTFRFFHRLENVKLADPAALAPGERPYVEALEFDVQALTKDGSEYQPLIDVRGLPCWPSQPDFDQLADGDRMRREDWDFESHWDRRKVGTRTLRVGDDFDFVVLGVGLGAIPYVARDLVERDQRWRDLVAHVPTVATQAFQIWMREDMAALGWRHRPIAVSGFVHPFDTWADMRHLISEESWPVRPRAIAYFCSALPDLNVNGPTSPESMSRAFSNYSIPQSEVNETVVSASPAGSANSSPSEYSFQQPQSVVNQASSDYSVLQPEATANHNSSGYSGKPMRGIANHAFSHSSVEPFDPSGESTLPDYSAARNQTIGDNHREQVRRNAIDFLNRDIKHLWPAATRSDGSFRWDLLAVPDVTTHFESSQARGEAAAISNAARTSHGVANSSSSDSNAHAELHTHTEPAGEARFNSQFWSANVSPSDRYVQSPPNTTRFRISPLDNTYDNMTIAGDWTACGLNVGCVEAAVISGRLAAHALSGSPALEDIVGYDHP